MENKIEIPRGLSLEFGKPNEEITRLLTDAGIKYKMHWERLGSSGYFRSSKIEIDSLEGLLFQQIAGMSRDEKIRARREAESKVIQSCGYPQNLNLNRLSYFAYYKIGQDFDLTYLTGRIMFKKGRLVERVMINIGQC